MSTKPTHITPIALARRVGVAPQEVYQAMAARREGRNTPATLEAVRDPNTGHWLIPVAEADRWEAARRDRRMSRLKGLTKKELLDYLEHLESSQE
jgi:hypothetical protein